MTQLSDPIRVCYVNVAIKGCANGSNNEHVFRLTTKIVPLCVLKHSLKCVRLILHQQNMPKVRL